jgi:predicted Co/Zn/Cd cation transporter (cation efflux family)
LWSAILHYTTEKPMSDRFLADACILSVMFATMTVVVGLIVGALSVADAVVCLTAIGVPAVALILEGEQA